MAVRSFLTMLAAGCAAVSTAAVAAPEASTSLLPSAEQQRFLRHVGQALRPHRHDTSMNVVVETPAGTTTEHPYHASGELLILLKPTLTSREVVAALREHGLELADTVPEIGLISVNVVDRLAADATDPVPIERADEASLQALARELSRDGRFVSVTPNMVVSPFQLETPPSSNVADANSSADAAAAVGERTDWGIADAKFDRIWPQMSGEFLVGVIDAGFADHEDLDAAPALDQIIPRNDHGNHVAGIMCAKHNSLGVRGALKNCRAAISVSSEISELARLEEEQLGIANTLLSFVRSVVLFMNANPNATVINLSLGYNWGRNFGLDPRAPDRARFRDTVRSQGAIVATILAIAKMRDVALVSAAGNDSDFMAPPLEAHWASPFNMGSKQIEDLDGWTNGLIIQAHDRQGRRASFSNVGGHLSCPGVDIESLKSSARNAYGLDSGTSMAAPYCAAGLMAVRRLRPELTLQQAIECLRIGPATIAGVPKLDVEFAVNRCRRG